MPVLPGYMGLHLLSGLHRGHRLPDKVIRMINKQFLLTITIIGEGGPIPVFQIDPIPARHLPIFSIVFDIGIDIVTFSSMLCIVTSLFKVVARL